MRLPKTAAEEFSNMLRLREIKHDVTHLSRASLVKIRFRSNSLVPEAELKSVVRTELKKVFGEHPYIKQTGSFLSRKPGLAIRFKEKSRHPYKMPKGLK